jgi:hypothetical protein
VTRIPLYYRFEEIQILRVKVFDCDTSFKSSDSSQLNLAKQDLQGIIEAPLASVVKNVGYFSANLQKPGGTGRGQLSVRTEEIANANGLVQMKLRCTNLVNIGTFSRNDSFIEISRLREDNHWAPCYKSEVKMANVNPVFQEIKGSVVQIANGDLYRPLKVSAFCYVKGGKHVLIGEAETSLSQLQAQSVSKSPVGLVNPKTKKPSGELNCDSFTLTPQPSFLEYIKGGTEVSFIVAIDFTASNGEATSASSLHYCDPRGILNQYASAITAIGSVIEFYDTDKQYAVYGFGGKPQAGQPVEHCFALNRNEGNPCVPGVHGILDIYYQSLQRVQLSGMLKIVCINTSYLWEYG